MRKIHLKAMLLTLWAISATSGHADTYDFELGVSYGASSSSIESTLSFGNVSPIEPIIVESDSDTDDIAFLGTWYFNGVTASTGPRSRAAFLGRASAVSLSFMRSTGDTTVTQRNATGPANPFVVASIDQRVNNFSVDLRYVLPESGWYGLASLSKADAKFDDGSGSTDFNADAYGVGIGKYIGSQTTLDLRLTRLESEATGFVIGGDSTSTEVAIAFSHIGSMGRTWQYGTDILLSTLDTGSSDGSFNARLSLYPTRPLAFGLGVSGALRSPGDGPTRYELFASWFPRESIELGASYGWVIIDEPTNTEIDEDNFGLGVNVRF